MKKRFRERFLESISNLMSSGKLEISFERQPEAGHPPPGVKNGESQGRAFEKNENPADGT